MNDFDKIKQELLSLYPGITDAEMTQATENLVNFYKTAVSIILKQDIDIDIKDLKSKSQSDTT